MANSSKPSQGKLSFYQSISCKSINVLFLLENHALFFTGKHGVQRNDSEPVSNDRVKRGCEDVISKIIERIFSYYIEIGLMYVEAAWLNALRQRGIWNHPWFKPVPCPYRDLCSVPNSTPRPGYVNSQLFSLPPVGILSSLCSTCI